MWVSMSSERAVSGMRMETAPLGETTSFTKKAVSEIIGPQAASYQPSEPSAKRTWKWP